MMKIASVGAVSVKMAAHEGVSETHCPPKMAASTSTNPRTEVSRTLPGRMRRRYTPIKTAMGMVMAMVNVPQGLDLSALTTISAVAPSRITMMLSTAT